MRIFLTGGTGFIGSYLVEKLLQEKHNLLILSRKPKSSPLYILGDLSNFDKWSQQVKRFQPEAAIHLAWENLPNYNAETSIRNLNYGINLYRFLPTTGCKLILTAGTGWEYGAQTGKLTENDSLEPLNTFVAAKIALYFLGRAIAAENDTKFVWVRIFYAYGAGQRKTSLIPRLINSAATGEAVQITNLSASHDFVYIEDVAEAILAILKKARNSSVYNIGSGKLTSIKKIIEIVGEKLGLPKVKQLTSSKAIGYIGGAWADILKIRKEVGWQPKTEISEGIEKTIRYYKIQKLL